MNLKIVYGIIFALFCIFQLGHAIQCYRCSGEYSCRSPSTFECNQMHANETSKFLDIYYLNVNTSQVSNSYSCMQQYLNFSSNIVVKYKGCVYAHMNSCAYTLRPYYSSLQTQWSCGQCNFLGCNGCNGCNPADRKAISMAAMVLPMIFVVIYKHFV